MIIESTGTPALYLGFTLLVVISLAVDFLAIETTVQRRRVARCCAAAHRGRYLSLRYRA